MAFYNAITVHSAIINRILAFGCVVLILSGVAFVAVNFVMSIEYRAIQIQRFKNDNVQLIERKEDKNSDDKSNKIIELFKQNKSLNEIALAVYGKKGGYYNTQIKAVLEQYGLDL